MKGILSLFYLFVIAVGFAFCSAGNGHDTGNNVKSGGAASSSPVQKIKTATLYSDLDNPWGMVWLPDGRLLVTERKGEVLIFKDDKYTGKKLSGIPAVFARGQGGLLDIQTHPLYHQNGWIYLAYSKPVEGGAATAIMRARIKDDTLVEKKDIFIAAPAVSADIHFGSRLVFDKNNYLFLVAGERGTKAKVQELSNDLGKIHRIYDDGRVPGDNPFVSVAKARSSIWSYGHRNPQGLVYDKENDRLWAVEHGPKGGDELNLIQKGKNYGWPSVTYGVDYDGSVISKYTEMNGMQQPVKYWVPSPAPCGMLLVTSKRYPQWKGDLLIAALAHKMVIRVKLSGTKFASQENLLKNIGRVRHLAQSPDGYIYIITEGPGKLLKLMPV